MSHYAIRLSVLSLICSASALSGCATTVAGHERALFYSASKGLAHEPGGGGLYWHWPWNAYITYDLRWASHKEEIHIHSKDGLHMDIDVAVVVRPDPGEIYALDVDVGPAFYDGVVKAERVRIQAVSQNLSPNYVRLKALEAMGESLGGEGTKLMVLPVGKDGLPSYFAPFLNPFSNFMGPLAAGEKARAVPARP